MLKASWKQAQYKFQVSQKITSDDIDKVGIDFYKIKLKLWVKMKVQIEQNLKQGAHILAGVRASRSPAPSRPSPP